MFDVINVVFEFLLGFFQRGAVPIAYLRPTGKSRGGS